MKLVLIDTFSASARINAFHFVLFHGYCRKAGESQPSFPSHEIGGDFSEPMILSRNGWKIPPVFKPITSVSLVLSSAIIERLDVLPNVKYLPVVFEKLVSFPFMAGDFSYFRTPEYLTDPYAYDHEILVDRLPDIPRLHEEVGPYYELVTGKYWKIKEMYSNRRSVRYRYPELGSLTEASLEFTTEMLQEYPIFRADGGTVFVAEYFERIRDSFDTDYFSITEIEF